MKSFVRIFSLSLLLAGFAAGALSRKPSAGVLVVPANAPVPVCPPGKGDCGIGKF